MPNALGRARGSFYALLLLDVAEEIDLARVREILGQQSPTRSPGFRIPAPDYVRFERPPAALDAAPITLESGQSFLVTLRLFEYGVISVRLEHRFDSTWGELVSLSQRLMNEPEIERRATDAVRSILRQIEPALEKPSGEFMTEDYFVLHLREVVSPDGARLHAEALLSRCGAEMAQVVRGESAALSSGECAEVLRGSLSYYPSDLLVCGWNGAVVYDTDEGAAPTLEILEYANSQLLEFRFYDDRLTRVLREAYDRLETRRGPFARWKLAREAESLNALRLDITELTERADNALKFVGDMYYARAYRLAADRVGVADYRRLVDEKLRTARELYDFMVNEFHHGRAFVLELAVVIILIIDLYFILREAKVF